MKRTALFGLVAIAAGLVWAGSLWAAQGQRAL